MITEKHRLSLCLLMSGHRAALDLLHKFHNAPVSYPTQHYFVTEIYISGLHSVTKECFGGHLSNYCGICEMGLWTDTMILI